MSSNLFFTLNNQNVIDHLLGLTTVRHLLKLLPHQQLRKREPSSCVFLHLIQSLWGISSHF